MIIRVAASAWASFTAQLLERLDVETAGILLCEAISAHVLVVRECHVAPTEAYLIRQKGRLQLDPVFLNAAFRSARDRGWSVVTIHTHPGAKRAWFSGADDNGDERLMPSLHNQIAAAVHGSMVIAGSGHVVARLFTADGAVEEAAVHVVGRIFTTNVEGEGDADHRYHRQQLALGRMGQARLRRLRVAVVGLGGIGSVVSAELAHLGIAQLSLMDGDVVDLTNLPRIVGAAITDVDRTMKVEVAAHYAKAIGSPTQIRIVPQKLLTIQDLAFLQDADVIMSCVDRTTPRALLNQFSYRCLIPVIDVGVGFRVDGDGRITGDAGRVVVVGPGRPCLACWGHIDPSRLRIEALGEKERERERAEGYIDGAEIEQPSVMPFNTMVAGAGVVELLRLVTHFAGIEDPPDRLAFSFSQGTVRPNGIASNSQCWICGTTMTPLQVD